jgi:hypothetical protein
MAHKYTHVTEWQPDSNATNQSTLGSINWHNYIAWEYWYSLQPPFHKKSHFAFMGRWEYPELSPSNVGRWLPNNNTLSALLKYPVLLHDWNNPIFTNIIALVNIVFLVYENETVTFKNLTLLCLVVIVRSVSNSWYIAWLVTIWL